MSTFRLADIEIRWSGTDDTTPPGHCLATGRDRLGNHRVWLFTGDTPTDEGFCGSLIVPAVERGGQVRSGRTSAYTPGGGWLTSGGDQADQLAHLAERAAR